MRVNSSTMVTIQPCHVIHSQKRIDVLCKLHGPVHPKCTSAVKKHTKLYIKFVKDVSKKPKYNDDGEQSKKDGD